MPWWEQTPSCLLQSEQLHHTIHDPRFLCRGRVDLREDVQTLFYRLHDPDSQTSGRDRQLLLAFAPHEYRARFRIDHDVEAVLRPVVDDEVESQSCGNPAARSLNDVHARPREAIRLEPAL